MTVIYFVNPDTKTTIAEIKVGKGINIHDGRLWKRLDSKGILVSPKFMKNNHTTSRRVFQKDNELLFDKAFVECYADNLRREGFFWVEKCDDRWKKVERPLDLFINLELSNETKKLKISI